MGWVGSGSPLSGPEGLLAFRRGQCQQVELREEERAGRRSVDLSGAHCVNQNGDNLLESESLFS